ncbi:unnamed protein product [Adineta steineri]|uniref:5'-nucleotidase n=1 Tax=Adineta steineri TaxID=433720 RepID=A0A815G442_9BILA|nr:unnamed protein product [Adineta steineri]CAF3899328.1 unnamed protein product [Adineta steineri]
MESSSKLVMCISSTALFDCNESHTIWKRDGLEAYIKHQREHIGIPLKPGVGFPLVRSLLELNKVVDQPVVEIVLVSRNDTESGQRIRESINNYKLAIKKMAFTGGTDVTNYLPAWKCDLFLSTEEEQVRKVLSGITSDPFEGIAAGLIYNLTPELLPVQPAVVPSDNSIIVSSATSRRSNVASWAKDQVRIVFDGDDVLYSKEPESKLTEYFEQETGSVLLTKGPMQAFALKLQNVRRALGDSNRWRIRTFLIIANTETNAERVFCTLKEWGLDIDETFILDGSDRTPFLRVIDPSIFFDYLNEHIEPIHSDIPAAHVPHSPRTTSCASIDDVVLTISRHVSRSSTYSEDDSKMKHLKNS